MAHITILLERKTSMSSQQQDSGKKKILPKDLDIVWGKDARYWRFLDNQSEDLCYAELLQVCWLEVTTKFVGLAPNKKYSVGFTISLNQDMFGWDSCPIYLMAKVGKKGKPKWKKINIDLSKRGLSSINIPGFNELSVDTIAGNSDESKVHVGLYEVWSGKWKGGLKIHCAFAQEVG